MMGAARWLVEAMMEFSEDLDPVLVQGTKHYFNQIPFNKVLGLELEYLGPELAKLRFDMKPELVGNSFQGILHGGVISSTLDVVGGMLVIVGAFNRTHDMPDMERLQLLSKIGTIDLRVDYLRPGRGEWFWAQGKLLRTGRKVAVTRMELHNQDDELLALGTGTYLCG